MTGPERGFLLLCSRLGDPSRNPLTVPQLRRLYQRASAMEYPLEDRDLAQSDLTALGCSEEMAGRILMLLSQEEELEYYISQGRQKGCIPLTPLSPGYPARLKRVLGQDAPGVLWAKGELDALNAPAAAVVGSRELRQENFRFALEAGRQAAFQGCVLVSGNARGADQAAQEAALAAGGSIVSIVADELLSHPQTHGVTWLCEEGYNESFSAPRALSRNRCIHALGNITVAAQSSLREGGTWDGCLRNLRAGWSPVAIFADGSEAADALIAHGAIPASLEDLRDLNWLAEQKLHLF